MLDDRGMGDARIGTPLLLGHLRVDLGQALDVGFIDD